MAKRIGKAAYRWRGTLPRIKGSGERPGRLKPGVDRKKLLDDVLKRKRVESRAAYMLRVRYELRKWDLEKLARFIRKYTGKEADSLWYLNPEPWYKRKGYAWGEGPAKNGCFGEAMSLIDEAWSSQKC